MEISIYSTHITYLSLLILIIRVVFVCVLYIEINGKMIDYITSKYFYTETLARFPALQEDSGLLALHLYLLKPKVDPDDKRIILPAVWLAALEGLEWDNNYAAIALLEQYKALVMPAFTWSGWSQQDGKSRRVLDLGWDDPYKELVFQERLGAFDDSGKIWFASGKTVNSKNLKIERDKLKMIAKTQLEQNTHNDDMTFIATYMNNTSINTFTKTIQRNMPAAKLATLDIIQSLDEKAQREELRYFMHSLTVLRTLEDYPQDNYTAVPGGTSRLFALTAGIQTLARPVRKALTKGWYEIDLVSAHTAINAKLWNVPTVQQFLSDTNNKLWKTLATDLNIELKDSTKEAMKRAFYALQYGGTISTVKGIYTQLMRRAGYDAINADRFMNHWIVKALLEGRDRFIDVMRINKGARGYYGDWFSLDDYDYKTILSHVATSYEIALIRPIFDVACTSDDFVVTVYQFDGVSISVNNANKVRQVFHRLEKAVNDKAVELGISTRLELPTL